MIESPTKSAFSLQKLLFFFSSKSALFFGKLLCEDCTLRRLQVYYACTCAPTVWMNCCQTSPCKWEFGWGWGVRRPFIPHVKLQDDMVALKCVCRGEDYKQHTKCISEEEKYSGKDYKAKPGANKGEKKQEMWTEVSFLRSAVSGL